TAVYLGALNTLNIDSNGWDKLWKGLGLILLIYGGLLMIGGASGSHSVWQPLNIISTSNAGNTKTSSGLIFTKVNNLAELEQQLAQTSQPVMLDLYADWCVECKRMEITTFQDPNTIQALKNTLTLQLDMSANTQQHKDIFFVFVTLFVIYAFSNFPTFREILIKSMLLWTRKRM
ncbi:MAG: thioredoxin family protein, partial [Flavobacteriaceae bacterium]|nr:thioredoxin family protein [Flavobacteriaceae bacterium]